VNRLEPMRPCNQQLTFDVSDDYGGRRAPDDQEADVAVDPVGVREIAERLGARRQTVAIWHHRGLLPPARWTVSGAPAWNWPDIERWAARTGRLPVGAADTTKTGAAGRRKGRRS
jgi:hypothetical protein